MAATAQDATALALTFFVSGWLLSLVVAPRPMGAATRAALGFALAVPATVLLAVPTLLARSLSVATLAGAGAVLVAAAAARVLPGARRRLGAARVPAAGERLGALRSRVLVALGVAAAAGVAFAAVLGPQLSVRGSTDIPLASPSWRYWNLAQTIASQGHIPATDLEWAGRHPFPTEYAAASIHAAATYLLSGTSTSALGDSLKLLDAYGLAMVVLALVAFFALWTRWLPPWWAALASVLTMSAARPALKFTSYRPESVGLLLVIWSVWLLDEAIGRRSPRWALMAGLVSATALLAHAEVWLLTPALWAGVVAGRLVVPWARSRRAKAGGPAGAPTIKLAVAAFLSFLACTALLFAATGTGARLGRIAGLGGRSPTAVSTSRPGRWGPDLTWSLREATVNPAEMHRAPPNVYGQLLSVNDTRKPWHGVLLSHLPLRTLLCLLAMVLLAATLLRRFSGGSPEQEGPSRADPATRREPLGEVLARGAATWVVFVALLAAVVFAIELAYHTYVPEYAGPYRLFPYYALALPGLLAGLALVASRALGRLLARTGAPSGVLGPLAASAATALALVAVVPWRVTVPSWDRALSPGAYRALSFVRTHTRPGTVVYTNSFTQGSIGFLTRREGWTDGEVPYVESRSWVEEAITRLVDESRYFADPARNGALLPRRVGVVVAAAQPLSVGGLVTFPVDLAQLRRSPRLRMMASFDRGRILVFRVDRRGSRGSPA